VPDKVAAAPALRIDGADPAGGVHAAPVTLPTVMPMATDEF
jgi:hypothetical protein